MRKLFTFIVSVFVWTAVANVNAADQKTVLKLIDWFGESICTPYVVDLSYDNGVYTINDFAGSGVPLSFMYTETFETIMTGDSFYSLDPDDPECDEYGLRNTETGENAILELKNYMDSGEDISIFSPTFFKSTCLVFEDETGPYLAGTLYGYEDLNDTESIIYVDMQLYFKIMDNNAVNIISINNSDAEYYNIQGQPVNNPKNGIFIKKINGKAVKVIL